MDKFSVTDRINCVSDAGTQYLVIETTENVEFNALSGSQFTNGGRKYILMNGESVNRLDDDTFQIFGTEEIIRKV